MSSTSGTSRYRISRPKLLVGVVICIVLIVTIALAVFRTEDAPRNAAPAVEPSPSDVPYVYVTAKEVVLMRDGRATARQAGSFGSDAELRDNLAWTHNGRYFAILEGNDEYGDTSARQLIVFDAQTDRVRTVPCPDCTSLAPIGDQQVVMGQRGSQGDTIRTETRILRLDVGSGRPPTLIQSNLPELTLDMRMIAGLRDNVLAAGSNADEVSESGGGFERLFLLDGGGLAHPIGETRGNVLVGLTATSAQDRAAKFAIDTGVRSGFCAYADLVSVIDGATGGRTETLNYSLVAPERKVGLDAGFRAHDLWWAGDGALYAAFESWECDDTKPEPRVLKIAPTVWRLDGISWTKIDTETVLSKRHINRDVQLSLIPSESAVASGDYSMGSTLQTKTDGSITHIADKVLFVSLPTSPSR